MSSLSFFGEDVTGWEVVGLRAAGTDCARVIPAKNTENTAQNPKASGRFTESSGGVAYGEFSNVTKNVPWQMGILGLICHKSGIFSL
jgi:hypothetical protein